jgi:hypothetical protein
MIEWTIRGRELANCNCDYGCPCQFNALPTHGSCEAAVGFEIDTGHFGDVNLDGLKGAGVYQWPGPVHEGGGTMQLIVDDGATEEQRDALLTIMTGGETEPMATMWFVYSAMCDTKLDPLSLPIALEVDVDARMGRVSVPGVFETSAEPIRNPVTGDVHRARIDLPNGFEYSLAEMASASTQATGSIKLDLKDSYGQFAELHLSNNGVVRGAA